MPAEETSRAPIIVAHRGYAACRPENTFAALDAAAAAGARWVEIDVQLSADGTPMVLHDPTLERVSGDSRAVFELTAAELAQLSVGEPGRFGTRYADARIPTLAGFAEWLSGQPTINAFIELKPESIERFGAATVVSACMAALGPATGRWAPISFDLDTLHLARDAGCLSLGWIVRGFDLAIAAKAHALPARWLFCNHERLPAGPLPAGPWDWVLYEIGDLATGRAMLARGARWLETMAVTELQRGLENATAQQGSAQETE